MESPDTAVRNTPLMYGLPHPRLRPCKRQKSDLELASQNELNDRAERTS
jgi:hypothetical protein